MGDRCSVTFQAHKDHRKIFELEDMYPEDEDEADAVWEFIDNEANYGRTDSLENLIKEGVPFIYTASEGSDDSSIARCYDGLSESHSSFQTGFGSDGYVFRTADKYGVIGEQEREEFAAFRNHLQRAQDQLDSGKPWPSAEAIASHLQRCILKDEKLSACASMEELCEVCDANTIGGADRLWNQCRDREGIEFANTLFGEVFDKLDLILRANTFSDYQVRKDDRGFYYFIFVNWIGNREDDELYIMVGSDDSRSKQNNLGFEVGGLDRQYAKSFELVSIADFLRDCCMMAAEEEIQITEKLQSSAIRGYLIPQ